MQGHHAPPAPGSATCGPAPSTERRAGPVARATTGATAAVRSPVSGGLGCGWGGRRAQEEPAREVEQAAEEDQRPERAHAEEPARAGAEVVDLHAVHPCG